MENISRVLQDMEMSGVMKFRGKLLFEGKFTEGVIEGNTLVIGERAEVHARIVVDNLTLHGHVNGEVQVADKCELKPTAHLEGNLTTARITMEDGAILAGGMRVARAPGTSPSPA